MRPSYHKQEKALWTLKECKHFVENARREEWWPLFVVALHTGCRIGELTGLRWSDLDAEKRILHVERSLQRISHEWVESTPKTKSGRRIVALTSVALEAFQRQREFQQGWRAKTGDGWQDSYGRIFTNRTGRPLGGDNASEALARLSERYGLPPISMHTLRHLNASLALQAGVPITLVSRSLGHANVSITMSTYAYAISDGQALSDALERVLGGV